MWRNRSLWVGLLILWALALLLPRPQATGPKGRLPWPPRSYAVYYGVWDHRKVAQAWDFELIVAHPGKALERFNADLIGRIRSGRNGILGDQDDRILLAYLSLGEDENPPVGPGPVPSRYVDRQRYLLREGFPGRDAQGLPVLEPGRDGIPDRNGAWGGYYVNPADPEWHRLLLERAQILRDRGVDGFFLDTLDVSPEFRPAMMDLLESFSSSFPESYCLANRGLDLWQAYPERFCRCLDGVVLESWFTHWDWHSQRGVLSPHRAQNREIGRRWLAATGLTRRPATFLLDYLDPQQPDRGVLLAERSEFENSAGPAFWSHPFLDRLEMPVRGSGRADLPAPRPRPRWTPLGLLELGLDEPCQVLALQDTQEYPLEGLQQPWAVGAAQALKVRRVEPDGTVSPWSRVELTPGARAWSQAWSAREREHSVEFEWNSSEVAQVWLGDQPGSLRPTSTQGRSPLLMPDLVQDRLYWVSLSHPGGIPDRVRPIRTHDVTPPAAPGRVWGRFHGDYLTVSWSPVKASDLAGYRVYVSLPKGPLALPYEVREGHHLEVKLPRQNYRVLVTSLDGGNHESQPGPALSLP